MEGFNTHSYAFFPNKTLIGASQPVMGTRELALQSSMPVGLAVHAADEERSLQLFFVSEIVAKRRSIESGWYVMSEPGKKFYLTVTNFHENGNVQFRGKKLAPDEMVGCQLFLGDRNIQMRGRSFCVREKSTKKKEGFVVERKRLELSGEWRETKTIRPFRFERVETTSDDIGSGPAPGLATLHFNICRVVRAQNAVQGKPSEHLKEDSPISASLLNEKQAKKKGISVQVIGDIKGEKISKSRLSTGMLISVEGSVKVFLRERWWLQAKKIIDLEGNPWRPKIDPISQVIDEDEPSEYVQMRRKQNVGSALASGNRSVPLIDLTAYE